jgi:hypothetical protein
MQPKRCFRHSITGTHSCKGTQINKGRHRMMYHHRHHWQNNPFWAAAFQRRFLQDLSLRLSGFHFFRFCNINSFTEQGCQPCIQPPTWRTRSLYLCLPVTGWPSYTPRHRVPFSLSFMTSRATVEVFCLHKGKRCITEDKIYSTIWESRSSVNLRK